MMGMWRWVSAGKAKLFELLTLTPGPQGPVLRLRHFDRELIGWEKEKERALTLPLVRYKEGEAVFEGLEAGGTTVRLIYRKPAADALSVGLEKDTKEGTKREEFRFRSRPAR